MAFAYRASSSAGNASGGALSINKPTGTTDGDLLIAALYLESDTNTFSSVPSGWTAGPAIANTGAFKLWTYWKWASSEPASWSWTPTTNAWRAFVVAAYSGGSGSGNPVDISGGSQGDAVITGSQTAPSVTTTADNDLVVFAYGNFNGDNPASINGFCTNLRIAFGSVTIADAIKTPAGATGTSNPNGMGNEDYAALHIGLLLNSGSAPKSDPASLRRRRLMNLVRRF